MAHIDFVNGEPVIGLPAHPAWTCLLPLAINSQVAIYVHQQIFSHYHFTVDKQIFGHPNIFVMFCYDPTSNVTVTYINLYANPNRNSPPSLKNTIPMLLLNLHWVDYVHVIQGDFNLHCHYWDKDSNDNPALAWDMIWSFHDRHLSLVNDESIPTFYCPNHRPQVLDLIWLNDNAYNWHGTQVIYDILGPSKDHKTLTLWTGDQSVATVDNQHLIRRYIPTGSEEEEHLVFQVFEEMPKWDHADPAIRAQQMIMSFSDAWDKFSKPGLAQFNQWWSADCQEVKLTYDQHPMQENQHAFL